MQEIKLSIQELHKRYGDHEVLKGVSLEARGALFGQSRYR